MITWRPARVSEDARRLGVLWAQRDARGFRVIVESPNWQPPEGEGWLLLYERVSSATDER